jgi:AP-1-like factor
MASTGTGGTLPPNFLLTPQQQNLLFAALNSNKQQLSGSSVDNSLTVSPTTFRNSAGQQKPATATGYQESPFLDNYDYDFGDSGFDFSFASEDQPSMIGDLPAASTEPNNNSGSVALSDSPETDTPEKRSYPDDEDDEDSPGGDHKRRESTDKVPKKPGRKPLTSEPSSVRFIN